MMTAFNYYIEVALTAVPAKQHRSENQIVIAPQPVE
jgi:hypothetical protein